MEIAPILIAVGIVCVIGGFLVIAFATITKVPDPDYLFDIAGFALFAAGIAAIWGAWHRLS